MVPHVQHIQRAERNSHGLSMLAMVHHVREPNMRQLRMPEPEVLLPTRNGLANVQTMPGVLQLQLQRPGRQQDRPQMP
jgi:hypothetical protein